MTIKYANESANFTVTAGGTSFNLKSAMDEIHRYSENELATTISEGLEALGKGVIPAELLIFGLLATEAVGRAANQNTVEGEDEIEAIERLVDELTHSDPDVGKAARDFTDKVYALAASRAD